MSSNEWKLFKLGDLSTKITKGTTPTTLGFPFIESGINFIKAESLTFEGTIDKSKFVFISEEANEKLKRSIIEEGDILFSMAGMVLGKSAVVRKEHLPANTNQALAIIRLDKKRALPNFVDYFMRQKSFFTYVNSSTGQSAQPNINLEEIGNLTINLPSIETQQKITSILSTLDRKIENNLQTNQTLEEIARTLFKEWFVYFNYPNADGSRKHSEFGEIPEDWKIGKFGDVAEQVKTSVNPSLFPHKKFHHYSLPAFDTDELPSLDFGETILSNKTIVKKYSVLISKLNPRIPRIWSIGDIDESLSICSTEFIGFTPKKTFSYSFINYFLKQTELVNRLNGIATGTSNSHQRIKPTDLLELGFPFPNEALIKQFDKIIKPTLEKRFQIIQENQTLKNLRDGLLPKLMKGEIKV